LAGQAPWPPCVPQGAVPPRSSEGLANAIALGCRACTAQYMDRIYVKHQNKTPVHQLGLNLWRDVVLRNRRIEERLQGILLDMVHRERTGEVIDRALMRSIIKVRGCARAGSPGRRCAFLRVSMVVFCCERVLKSVSGGNLWKVREAVAVEDARVAWV
jgi:Cullin family